MKYNKASQTMSRRNFAKTVAASVIAAPLISAQTQLGIYKEHIPPVVIGGGSVILYTQDLIGDHADVTDPADIYPRKYVIKPGAQIKSVRVINTNGTILADYYGNNLDAYGGQINMWVNKAINVNPNMVIRTVGADRSLKLEIDNKRHKFDKDTGNCPTYHQKKRRTYSDSNASLCRVSICRHDGTLLCDVVSDPDHEIEIDRILIWME